MQQRHALHLAPVQQLALAHRHHRRQRVDAVARVESPRAQRHAARADAADGKAVQPARRDAGPARAVDGREEEVLMVVGGPKGHDAGRGDTRARLGQVPDEHRHVVAAVRPEQGFAGVVERLVGPGFGREPVAAAEEARAAAGGRSLAVEEVLQLVVDI